MSVYRTVTVKASLTPKQLNANAEIINNVRISVVNDYNVLENKPQINSVVLEGNKMLPEIGVDSLSNTDIERILT